MKRVLRQILLSSACLAFASACDKGEPLSIYHKEAAPKADIRTAAAEAANTNKHVLVVFGANWCKWCRRLHHLFTTPGEVKILLDQNYQVVHVDVGRWNRNLDVTQSYNIQIKEAGIPYLVVLDSEGRLLARQPSGPLGSDELSEYDSAKVARFLASWRPPAVQHVAEPPLGDLNPAAFRKEDRPQDRGDDEVEGPESCDACKPPS
jgi:thioredoxin-related protein